MGITRDQLIRHLEEVHGYDAYGTKDTHGDDLWIATLTTPIKMLVDFHDDDHADDSQNYKPHNHAGSMAEPGELDSELLQELTAAAMMVVDNWEGSNLAEAVNELEQVILAQQKAKSARWLVTQLTFVTATNETDAIEWVVGGIKAGDQEVKLQTAERWDIVEEA